MVGWWLAFINWEIIFVLVTTKNLFVVQQNYLATRGLSGILNQSIKKQYFCIDFHKNNKNKIICDFFSLDQNVHNLMFKNALQLIENIK